MRAAIVSICLVTAAAIAIAASASAQTFQKKSDGGKSVPMSAQQFKMKPQGETTAPPPKVLSPTAPARPKNMPSTTAPKGKNKVPLTAQDCDDLGGQILISTLCKSNFACSHTDQNGKTHSVCIGKK